jgi:hypothetical protein
MPLLSFECVAQTAPAGFHLQLGFLCFPEQVAALVILQGCLQLDLGLAAADLCSFQLTQQLRAPATHLVSHTLYLP